MATYQDIKGLKVKYLSADPSTLVGGDVWYNSTTGTLKGVVNVQSFSSGAPVSTARGWCAFAGDKSTALLVGGSINPYSTVNTGAEEYNGTGWTSATSAPFAGIGTVGCGTQTSALVFGGGHTYTNASAEYDGSSWTVTGVMNLTCRSRSSAGTQTAGLGANAYVPGSQAVTTTEEYNGTGWTTVTSSGTARYDGAGLGIQTAAISCGGRNPPTTSLSAAEDYDGSAWTAAASMPAGREYQGGSGTQTAATVFGGTNNYPSYPAFNTKLDYDGSTWSTSPATLATGRRLFGGQGGTSADVLCASGSDQAGTGQTYITNTEEFNNTINTITAGAWASGGAMNTARYNMQSSPNAPADAGLAAGGITGTPSATQQSLVVEEYDGDTWTTVTGMPVTMSAGGGAGTQTAYISMGGYANPPLALSANTFNYNGTSWTALTAIPTATGNRGVGCGTSTAALLIGGKTPAAPGGVSAIWEYNAPAWTAGSAMSNIRWQCGSAGVQTAGLAIGGATSTPIESTSEEYNGASWTTGGTLVTGKKYFGSNGAQTDALAYGTEPGSSTDTQGYDGTAWSTRPSLATARAAQGSGGGNTGSSALTFGGTPSGGSPVITTTEEFTGETSVATASTLTTS